MDREHLEYKIRAEENHLLYLDSCLTAASKTMEDAHRYYHAVMADISKATEELKNLEKSLDNLHN